MSIRAAWRASLVLGVCTIAVLSPAGCGLKADIPIEKAQSDALYTAPIAVIVLTPEKRVEFVETLLRPGWAERRASYYTYEGIWDSSVILRTRFVETLRREFQLYILALWEKIDGGTYNRVVEESETLFNAARHPVTVGSFGKDGEILSALAYELDHAPPDEYLRVAPPDSVLSLAKTVGADYILELSFGGIGLYRVPLFTTSFVAMVYCRLVRVSDGAVLWLDTGAGLSDAGKVKDFADLEQNDLEGLKRHYTKAVDVLFDTKKMGGSFLKTLFPK